MGGQPPVKIVALDLRAFADRFEAILGDPLFNVRADELILFRTRAVFDNGAKRLGDSSAQLWIGRTQVRPARHAGVIGRRGWTRMEILRPIEGLGDQPRAGSLTLVIGWVAVLIDQTARSLVREANLSDAPQS